MSLARDGGEPGQDQFGGDDQEREDGQRGAEHGQALSVTGLTGLLAALAAVLLAGGLTTVRRTTV